MNIGLIGLGKWGKNHLRTLQEIKAEGWEIEIHTCDTDLNQTPEYTDYADMLPNVDAVIIAAPSHIHYRIAYDCLQVGKHVFVEKPMAMNSNQAWDLIYKAEGVKKTLMPGHIFRYHPAVQELKNASVNSIFISRAYKKEPRKDMGIEWALTIHDVDLCAYLSGNESIIGAGVIKHTNTELLLELHSNSKLCVIYNSWENDNARSMTVNYGNNNIKVIDFQADTTEPILKTELKDFIRCCQSGEQPLSDMYSGARAVELIERLIK